MAVDTGTITEVGTTDPVSLGTNFNISLVGFGTAVITLERSTDGGTHFGPVDEFTEDTERSGYCSESAQYRLNCTYWQEGAGVWYRLGEAV